MASPMIAAEEGSLAEYEEACAGRPDLDPLKYFLNAAGNRDPQHRVEILTWMLDRGADPAQRNSRSGINALHVLFSHRVIGAELEALVLRRLFEGGIDINAVSPRFGLPLQVLYSNYGLADAELTPYYDIIFTVPGIDWDVRVNKKGAEPKTLRQLIETDVVRKPEMIRRMHEHIGRHRAEQPARSPDGSSPRPRDHERGSNHEEHERGNDHKETVMPDRIEFIPRAGACTVTKNVMSGAGRVRWMVRETSKAPADNGWVIMSHIDTEEYLRDGSNWQIADFNDVCAIEPALIGIWNLPVGSDLQIVRDGRRIRIVDTPTGREIPLD